MNEIILSLGDLFLKVDIWFVNFFNQNPPPPPTQTSLMVYWNNNNHEFWTNTKVMVSDI